MAPRAKRSNKKREAGLVTEYVGSEIQLEGEENLELMTEEELREQEEKESKK